MRELADPLSPENLIGADAPLLDFVYTADSHGCRLILDRTDVTGIVTLSDIQRLPVRTALFSLFIHLELLLTVAIKARMPVDNTPFDLLSTERRKKLQGLWKKQKKENVERDEFALLMFYDKTTLASKLGLLGEDVSTAQQELALVQESLRNPIAHGDDFALSAQSARDVVASARLTRDWIVRARCLVAGLKL